LPISCGLSFKSGAAWSLFARIRAVYHGDKGPDPDKEGALDRLIITEANLA